MTCWKCMIWHLTWQQNLLKDIDPQKEKQFGTEPTTITSEIRLKLIAWWRVRHHFHYSNLFWKWVSQMFSCDLLIWTQLVVSHFHSKKQLWNYLPAISHHNIYGSPGRDRVKSVRYLCFEKLPSCTSTSQPKQQWIYIVYEYIQMNMVSTWLIKWKWRYTHSE